MINVGDILSTVGCSVPWGISWVPWGILSAVGDTQYRGGYHDARGDIMTTVEVFSTVRGKSFVI